MDPLPRRWALSVEARDWGPEGSGRAYEDLSLILVKLDGFFFYIYG